jgi:DNA-binding response OmpR family regulator
MDKPKEEEQRALIVDAVHSRPDPPVPDAIVESDPGPDWDEVAASPLSFMQRLGREPIRLSGVEFRILSFLAARPYHAFTRRRIAEAVSRPERPVTEESLDEHILGLRDKLGFFRDFVQSVPYIGYRFKP